MKRLAKSLLVLSLFFVLITPQLSLAHSENEDSQTIKDEPKNELEIEHNLILLKEKSEQRLKIRKERIASKAAEIKEKLDERRKKICENRSEKIIKRSTQLSKRAEKQLNKFTEIANRVDNFYLNKLVPKGVTVSNYESLKSDIEARKQEVKDAIEAAKEAAKNFDCAGDNPKGQLETYRLEMKDAIAALKDFRISIKNFIVAIRTAAKANNATGSAVSGE